MSLRNIGLNLAKKSGMARFGLLESITVLPQYFECWVRYMTHKVTSCSKKNLAKSVFCLVGVMALSGCDGLVPKGPEKLISKAEEKVTLGDYPGAIQLYEKALDGTEKTADVHFRLGLIYDDKLHEPVSAVHHFNRYLQLEPKGKRSEEVKGFVAKCKLGLVTALSGGVVLSESDAVKLRNENLSMRSKISDLKIELKASKAAEAAAMAAARAAAKGNKNGSMPTMAPKPIPPTARIYIVQTGDTLASISQKFYNSKGKWKDILDANTGTLESAAKLKIGQRLVIP